jgi:hypothetical protein
MTTFVVEAISAVELDAIRATMRDSAGNKLAVETDEGGGSPLRCCLRETGPGEKVLLISYMPPGGTGGYAERGPVFIHAESCGGYTTASLYPPELRHRRQTVRAYNEQGRIEDGVLADDGEHAEKVIEDLLARPDVVLVQLRNVGYGCYNFAARHA